MIESVVPTRTNGVLQGTDTVAKTPFGRCGRRRYRILRMCTLCTRPNMANHTIRPDPP